MMQKFHKILIAIFFLGLLNQIQAQEFKQDLEGVKKIKILMSGASDLKIISGSTNDILIKHLFNKDEDDKKDGLKAIYPSGYDNTDIGLSVTNNNGVLTIKKLNLLSDDDYSFVIPNDMALSVHCMLGGDIDINGFSSEIEVQTLSGDINIMEVTGPIMANATTGDITIKFDKIAQESPMSIVALTGDIHLEMPKNSKANLVMETMTGNSYTDLDIDIMKDEKAPSENKEEKDAKFKAKKKNKIKHHTDEDDEKSHNFNLNFKEHMHNLHSKIQAKLNGGGVEILAKTLSGDVIIRERK